METKTCRECGRELPVSAFRMTRWGTPTNVCRDCIEEKRSQSRYDNNQMRGAEQHRFSDPDFDGRTIGDVWRQMCRAEKWLESRGCVIKLNGEFHELKITKLKKE